MPLQRHPLTRVLYCVSLVAWALCSLASVTNAADCTYAQLAEVSTLSSNVTTICGSDALSTTTTAYCDDSSCLAYLTSMVSNVPSCEVNGYNLRTVLTTAMRSCNAASDAVPALKSNSKSLHHPHQWTAALLLLQVVFVLGVASGIL